MPCEIQINLLLTWIITFKIVGKQDCVVKRLLKYLLFYV